MAAVQVPPAVSSWIRKSKLEVPMDSTKEPKEDLKTIAELMTHFNEVTDRLQVSHEKLQQRIQELQKELEDKNRLLKMKNRLEILGEMAACLAHEIRNPLGGIGLFTDLLRKKCESEDEKLALILKISSGVQILNKLVEDMLSFTTTVEPHREKKVLETLIDEALVFSEEALRQNSVTIRRAYPSELTSFGFDPSMLRRVFLNIILNAAQAMKKGGELVITSQRNGKGVQVSFSDTGPGLSPEMMGKLFTPFYTSKTGGTGLGLTMARKLVEVHGGTIEAVNHPKGGAVFTVHLPIEERA